MSQVETIALDETKRLIVAKPSLEFASIDAVYEVKPGGEHVLLHEAPLDKPEEKRRPMVHWARVKSVHQGVIYENGQISAIVLSEHGKTDETATKQTITVPVELSQEQRMFKDIYKIPIPTEKHFDIQTYQTPRSLSSFEEEYASYARDHPSTENDPSEVLVRPAVLQEIKEIGKDRTPEKGSSGLNSEPGDDDKANQR